MGRMTRQARDRKKTNHRKSRPHPAHVQRVNPDHIPLMHVHDDGTVHRSGSPLPVMCPVCRPAGKRWDRGLAGKAAA